MSKRFERGDFDPSKWEVYNVNYRWCKGPGKQVAYSNPIEFPWYAIKRNRIGGTAFKTWEEAIQFTKETDERYSRRVRK